MATGVVRNRWLISENKTRFLMIATSLGALVNVTLNLALIPSYHSVGAAWATVISYGVSTYISCLLAKEYRLVFKVLSKGYAVPIRLGDLVTFAKKLIFEKIMPMSR
jgi:Na+-driven multidrug efflux pump